MAGKAGFANRLPNNFPYPYLTAFQFLYKYANMNMITKVEPSTLTQSDLNFPALAIKIPGCGQSGLLSGTCESGIWNSLQEKGKRIARTEGKK